jgi:oxygen-dependent protoporphyrinogen oxidase
VSGRRVVVLGGGITGLVCAYELEKKGASPVLLEAKDRLGGKVWSPRANRDGLIFEAGPDSFVTTKPAAIELALELGLEDKLLTTHAEKKGMWVYTRGKLRRFPEGLLLMAPTKIRAFLASDVVGWFAKIRMAGDFFLPAGSRDYDEAVGAFAARRFGVDAAESFINPVMAGIHSGDPDKLSLKSTFPQFFEMERKYGSVWRAMRAGSKRRPPPRPNRTMFMTLKGGLETLTQALAAKLSEGTVRLGARVESIAPAESGGYALKLAGGETVEADRVVSTLPAPVLAPMLEGVSAGLAKLVSEIYFASTATISLAYDAAAIPKTIVNGFGFVIDRREKKTISGATYSSTKFPGRVPEGTVLVRCFAGGAGHEQALDCSDEELVGKVRADLREIAGIDAAPAETKVARWPNASPQYNVGHEARVGRIEQELESKAGLLLAGASYKGIGLPDCVRSGREAAAKALEAESPSGLVV